MQVKNIVFDLGGVLINLNVPRCINAFTALMGPENMRAVLGMDEDGEGVKSVSIANRQLMADFERGNISTQDFVAQILPYCRPGTTEQDIKDAWMSMVAELPQERLDIVAQLKQQGYRIYMLSNGNDLHVGTDKDVIWQRTYSPLACEPTVEAEEVAIAIIVDAVTPLHPTQCPFAYVEGVTEGVDDPAFRLHLPTYLPRTEQRTLRAATPTGPERNQEVIAAKALVAYGILPLLVVEERGSGLQLQPRQRLSLHKYATRMHMLRKGEQGGVVGTSLDQAVVYLDGLAMRDAVAK